jgi:hypothetical protein
LVSHLQKKILDDFCQSYFDKQGIPNNAEHMQKRTLIYSLFFNNANKPFFTWNIPQLDTPIEITQDRTLVSSESFSTFRHEFLFRYQDDILHIALWIRSAALTKLKDDPSKTASILSESGYKTTRDLKTGTLMPVILKLYETGVLRVKNADLVRLLSAYKDQQSINLHNS